MQSPKEIISIFVETGLLSYKIDMGVVEDFVDFTIDSVDVSSSLFG